MDTKFNKALAELAELHDRKSADYGTGEDPYANIRAGEEFGIPPWVTAAMKANDKMARLQSYARKGRLANEGVRESLVDLAVYAVIALVMWDEAQDREVIRLERAKEADIRPVPELEE